MLPDYEIVLGRGIGDILFGIPKQELAEILGVPDEIDNPEDPERIDWEIFGFNSINCLFSFDPDYEDRLVEIVIENGYFHIGKKIRVGVRKEDLLNSGVELKFGKSVIQDMSTEELPTHELISYDQAGLHLWLDDGIISSIQISPLLNEEGLIIWPEDHPTEPIQRSP
ncbi:MAG: hypothetical protein D4R97_03265 [Bacteroidetes bacterium]|nr:MAG: hypothetical protein D4R97_03265 [Bacteroidota bacterium]